MKYLKNKRTPKVTRVNIEGQLWPPIDAGILEMAIDMWQLEKEYEDENNGYLFIDPYDDGWMDWENYLEELEIADLADQLLFEYEEEQG